MLKEKIKSLMTKEQEKDSKKKIENLVVFVLILVVTIIIINSIWNGEKKETPKESVTSNNGKQLATKDVSESDENENDIETKLEKILSNINGVGKVKVLVTYSESSQVVAMYNENSKNSQVEEKDSTRSEQGLLLSKISKKILSIKKKTGKKCLSHKKLLVPKLKVLL